jgi:hypothetical protein
MLSGKRAFKRDTSSDTIAESLKEDPPALTNEAEHAPALDRIVRHCPRRTGSGSLRRDIAFA